MSDIRFLTTTIVLISVYYLCNKFLFITLGKKIKKNNTEEIEIIENSLFIKRKERNKEKYYRLKYAIVDEKNEEDIKMFFNDMKKNDFMFRVYKVRNAYDDSNFLKDLYNFIKNRERKTRIKEISLYVKDIDKNLQEIFPKATEKIPITFLSSVNLKNILTDLYNEKIIDIDENETNNIFEKFYLKHLKKRNGVKNE